MPDSLIIDARHRLRWHQRLASDAGTALLWGVWLWLWRPLLHAAAWVGGLGAASAAGKLLAQGPLLAAPVAGVAATLLLWRLLPARRPRDADARPLEEYARHFGLPADLLQQGREARICVVHHDDAGRIVRLDTRPLNTAPDASPART